MDIIDLFSSQPSTSTGISRPINRNISAFWVFEAALSRRTTTSVEQDIPRPVSPALFRPNSVPSVDDVPIMLHIGQGDTRSAY